jgi:UPF0716 protein FxsA
MRTLGKLFFLFTVVSAVELYLLFRLAQWTSWPVTIATVLVPGMLGAWLAKREGARVLRQIREAMVLGQEPAQVFLDGAAVLVASAFLIAPGVLTDVTGLLLLAPPVRRRVIAIVGRYIRKAIDRRLQNGNLFVFAGPGGGPRFDESPYEVIDAEDIPRQKPM